MPRAGDLIAFKTASQHTAAVVTAFIFDSQQLAGDVADQNKQRAGIYLYVIAGWHLIRARYGKPSHFLLCPYKYFSDLKAIISTNERNLHASEIGTAEEADFSLHSK
jgi:hypothetical protein